MKLHIIASASLLTLATPTFANTQTISYVETDGIGTATDPVITNLSGKVIYQDAGGAYNRAVSAIGTNKLYARGNGTSELNGGSAWMDSYTVQGTGTVDVSLSFTVDGVSAVGANAGGDGNPFDWTYRVVALKGDNWKLGGQGTTYSVPGSNWPIRTSGDNYESMLLTRPAPADATVTNTYQPRFGGSTIWNVKNFGDEPGQYAPSIARSGNNFSVYTMQNNRPIRLIYQPTQVRITDANTGATIQTQPYSQFPQQAVTYQNLLKSYPILAQTGLCQTDLDTGLCPGNQTFEPTTMTLNFSLEAGEKFTLLSYLSFINLRDGEFDFYNTAKLSGIGVSPGATLTSGSGQLQALAGGGFGYAPLTLGVPEPASWALMIGGFGLIGGVSRRRQRQAANAASNAVAAPRVA